MSAKKNEQVVKPQVIDLDAESVTEIPEPVSEAVSDIETPGQHHAAAGQTSEKSTRPKLNWSLPLVMLLAGTALGGWLYRDVLSSYIPSDETKAVKQQLAALETTQKETRETLSAVVAKSTEQQTAIGAFEPAISALKTQLDQALTKNADISTRLDKIEKSTQSLESKLKQLQLQPTNSNDASINPTALVALQQQVTEIETDVAALKQHQDKPSKANQLIVALSALTEKIDKGSPIQSELDALTLADPALVVPQSLTNAATAAPQSSRQLIDEVRALAQSLPNAATGDDEPNGYWARLKSAVGGFVSIKKSGTTDWQLIATQAADLGELQKAIDLLAANENPPSSIATWLAKARNRITLDAEMKAFATTIMQRAATP
jgi:hypothetical protein